MIELLLLFPLFLCWGSFLNVVAYRLIHAEQFVFGRSYCPPCKATLYWYDMIPLVSFFALKGKCRFCSHAISWLYPAIELATASTLAALYVSTTSIYFTAYFVLFSALIVTIRTDMESMLISRWVTLALVPFGLIMSLTHRLPLSWLQSLIGCFLGYGIFWIVSLIFQAITKKPGIGEGDFDLLALVGTFTGPLGVWATILLGSVLGTVVSLGYMIAIKEFRQNMRVPFGPFLAIGAMTYILVPSLFHTFIGL